MIVKKNRDTNWIHQLQNIRCGLSASHLSSEKKKSITKIFNDKTYNCNAHTLFNIRKYSFYVILIYNTQIEYYNFIIINSYIKYC